MLVRHFARGSVAVVAALSLVLSACSSSTEPDAPFDPDGTSADLEAVGNAFNSPVGASYAELAGAMGVALGGSAPAGRLVVSPLSRSIVKPSAAMEYAKALASRATVHTGARPSFSSEAIPTEFRGKTFEWDVETNEYVATERTGAPSNGVRFILYAIDPITHDPVEEPLTEVGYAQITSTQANAVTTVRMTLVSGETTYLDYTIVVNSATLTLAIDGFATDGTDRANFSLDFDVGGSDASFTYVVAVPTRGFRVETRLTGHQSGESTTSTLHLVARGPHGRVNIDGTLTDGDGTVNVSVNGELFATIVTDGPTTTVTGANGGELTEQERETLGRVFGIFEGSAGFLIALTIPVLDLE